MDINAHKVIHRQYVSPNFDSRNMTPIDMVVLHYTNMPSAEAALERLCDGQAEHKVSAHYLIDEGGRIYMLVDEAMRAWHAGVAYWQGETDINACSVGIELAHVGYCQDMSFAPFPELQMQSLLALLADIQTRHHISLARYLGHSDIAPDRKTDPGEMFDWEYLAVAGFGLVSTASGDGDDSKAVLRADMTGQHVQDLQHHLAKFGYGITPSGIYDVATQQVVAAFQGHYRRHLVDGLADAETQMRLLDLLTQKE